MIPPGSTRPVRGAVFDLDGTLVDRLADVAAALSNAFEAAGLPRVNPEQVEPAMGHWALDLVTAVAATVDPARVSDEAFVRELCAAYQQHYAAQPAALTTVLADGSTALPALRKSGLLVGVCTNKSTHLAEEVLRAVGLGDTVEVVLGRDAVAHPKPDPSHLLEVLDKPGLAPEETVYVGDNPIDLDLATGAGVRYRHMAWGVPVDDGVALLSRFDDLIPPLSKEH
ncbi:phosphoglycolate phosphatase [soil metagenome]